MPALPCCAQDNLFHQYWVCNKEWAVISFWYCLCDLLFQPNILKGDVQSHAVVARLQTIPEGRLPKSCCRCNTAKCAWFRQSRQSGWGGCCTQWSAAWGPFVTPTCTCTCADFELELWSWQHSVWQGPRLTCNIRTSRWCVESAHQCQGLSSNRICKCRAETEPSGRGDVMSKNCRCERHHFLFQTLMKYQPDLQADFGRGSSNSTFISACHFIRIWNTLKQQHFLRWNQACFKNGLGLYQCRLNYTSRELHDKLIAPKG